MNKDCNDRKIKLLCTLYKSGGSKFQRKIVKTDKITMNFGYEIHKLFIQDYVSKFKEEKSGIVENYHT